ILYLYLKYIFQKYFVLVFEIHFLNVFCILYFKYFLKVFWPALILSTLRHRNTVSFSKTTVVRFTRLVHFTPPSFIILLYKLIYKNKNLLSAICEHFVYILFL